MIWKFLDRYSGGGVEPSFPPSGMLKVVPNLKALTRAAASSGAAGGAEKRSKRSTASLGRSSDMDGEHPVMPPRGNRRETVVQTQNRSTPGQHPVAMAVCHGDE